MKERPDLSEDAYLQGQVQFDYGWFTRIGENTYVNFNSPVWTWPVKIGSNVFMGPNVRF